MEDKKTKRVSTKTKAIMIFLLCLVCVGINYGGSKLANALHLPVFLDSVGTMMSAALGGGLPGVIVGYLTNLINGISDPITMYYGILNVMIAIFTAVFYRRGFLSLKKPGLFFLAVFVYSLIGGALGSVITWLLYGFSFGTGISAPLAEFIYRSQVFDKFWSQFSADMLIDLLDKLISVGLMLMIIKLLPKKIRAFYKDYYESEGLLLDAPEMMREMFERGGMLKPEKHKVKKSFSLKAKVLMLLVVASILIGTSASIISFLLFRESEERGRTNQGIGVSNVAARMVDGDHVKEYLSGEYDEDEYKLTAIRIGDLRNYVPDVEDLYILSITEKGVKIVFGEDKAGNIISPGTIKVLDEEIKQYYADLCSGKEVPIIKHDTEYGEVISVSNRVFDSHGKCVAYSIVNISTDEMKAEIYEFLIKVITLFFGIFLLILTVSLFLAEKGITTPINDITGATQAFAYDTEEARDKSVEKIENLNIRTGDEIENLYHAIAKTTHDTVGYIDDVNEKNNIIMKMQNGMIMVLADMVEGRDQNTGDHVRKTAAYVRLILNKLREAGKYTDKLTDKYIEDVVSSAPLHDVGKIGVSDLILNKEGPLEKDEFDKMKLHTVYGDEMITKAMSTLAGNTGYLMEAKNLARYHHERWNGKGYPDGLKGEEIPLSARVMAVADVFDALVSKRCYKPPFSYEKAFNIIEEEIGEQFDPEVAKAFLAAKEEAIEIAKSHIGEL